MRKYSKNILDRIAARNLSEEYACVNALQETPFRTNNPIVEILRNVWEGDSEWAGLPPRNNLDLPPYPFDKEPSDLSPAERDEFKSWRGKRNQIYSFNAKSMSKRIQVERTIQLAEGYMKYDQFYFVHQLDFRGRKYPVESFMSPQVADYGKACIEFANGVEMLTQEDAYYLAIEGANRFGNDKVSLNDRERWSYHHEGDIVKTVENPYDYLWWTQADKPFQFLAWCFEFYGWLRQGKGFVTHLPTSADGSCNGLQHLSAILLDEHGGAAVNLLPSELPRDIYSDVAKATRMRVELDARDGSELAKQCLDFGIDRKTCKRSTMIIPYSGTQHACRKYIEDSLAEAVAKGKSSPWNGDYFSPSLYLSKHVWDSINEVIVSARKVMDYVRNVGKAYALQNKAMEWVTPTNFLVVQHYPNLELRRIKTHIDGNVVSLAYQEQDDTQISKSKTASGSSPNFIHSLDASALTRTVNCCTNVNIKDFSMVHDSYGTHSPNMFAMQEILREEFVSMYKDHDVLEELSHHAEQVLGHGDLPPLPTRGSLNLDKVLESKYFFA
jgi:DNA-directed RNA polymerase